MNKQVYLDDLNPQQKDAVTAPLNKPLKITAGAGTGKTRTLTSRYVHCLADNPGWSPENLLALTFTDKAAAEMRNRIARLCREINLFSRDSAMLNAWIGTFHSICSRILRENSLRIGWNPEFTVLTDLESKVIFNSVIDDILNLNVGTGDIDLNSFQELPFAEVPVMTAEIYDLVSKLKDSFLTPMEFRVTALAKLEEFRDNSCRLQDVVEKCAKGKTKSSILNKLDDIEVHLLLEEEWINFIYLAYREYQTRLASEDAMDFADLIFMTYRLLKDNKELLAAYRSQFKHIFVDEFQDTSESQFKLLSLLAADDKMSNVTVVGDEKQAIYAWRNARPENMGDFAAALWGGKEVHLNTNYRSKKGILDVSHFFITQQEQFKNKEDKIRLQAGRDDAEQGKGHVLVALYDEETQAKVMANEIQKLVRDGCRPGDIAVLFRSLKYCKLFEDELRKRSIPYRTLGGTGFYERLEVQDILAYLRIINNPTDKNSLLWILMRPPVGLTDNQLYQLSNTWEKTEEGMKRKLDVYEALAADFDETSFGKTAVVKIKRLLKLFRNALNLKDSLSAPVLLDYILTNSGYLQYLYTKPENEVLHSLANINKLRSTLADFEGKHGTVGLDDIIRLLEVYQDDEAEAGSSEENAVHLMTVHKAKGLEFKYVFLVQVVPGRFPFSPRYPNLVWDDKQGLLIKNTVKYGNIFSISQFKNVLNNAGLINNKALFKETALDEDRRVFYVALTRAEDRVYLLADEPKGNTSLPQYYEEIISIIGDDELGKYCLPWQGNINDAESSPAGDGCEEQVLNTILSWPDKEPAKDEEKHLSLSFTSMLQYKKCPRQYYYSTVMGIPAEDVDPGQEDRAVQEYDAVLLGSIVHNAIQRKETFKDQEDVELLLEKEAVLLGLPVDKYRERYRDTASACVNNYISLSTKSNSGNIYTEKEFHTVYQLEEGTLEFKGYIDRLEIDGSKAKIIDFKTNRVLDVEKIENYSLQLRLYACAVKRIFPQIENIELELWHLNEGEVIKVDAGLNDAEAELINMGSAILREEYPARKTKGCEYCSYRLLCE
ncbi:superfamily I DNA/RNA helicase/RecB family exonuclease [Desulfohalotomaculum tongense]|uniref:UvrD-helicase domain-containing protein n=1 Tax=Desulforadius tongensis TaxID=1216062 RepID=UPI001959EE45|nr:superfamily I DNA/RNA helicase/RecB family exonuclease [Desulforadius tongensis]